jgi:hypothetical protein
MPYRVEFYEDHVRIPASRAWYSSAGGDELARGPARAAMFEAFLWLQLGTQTGYFRRDVAEHLAREYFDRFFASLADYENEDLRSLRVREERPLPLWDPEGRDDLQTRFSEHDATLRHAVAGKGLWLPPQEYAYPQSLHAAVQSLLLGAARLAADRMAQECAVALGYWHDHFWEQAMQARISAESVMKVAETGDSNATAPKAAVCVGFFRLLRHLYAFHDMARGLQECEVVAFEDSLRLVRTVRELHAWRLDLRRERTKHRFRVLADEMNEAVNEELMLMHLETGEDFDAAMDWVKHAVEAAALGWGPQHVTAPPAEMVLVKV